MPRPLSNRIRLLKHSQDVKEKIETGTYNEPIEFLEDINLICDNAMTYNPPDNDVYQMYASDPAAAVGCALTTVLVGRTS